MPFPGSEDNFYALGRKGSTFYSMRTTQTYRSAAPKKSLLRRLSENGLLLNLVGQFRQGFEQIRDQAIIGHLEDGGVGIFVDGNDHFGILHARQMLDRT